MRWFKHMSASWNDEKIASLVGNGGETGLALYGAYWRIVEIVASQIKADTPGCAVSYTVRRWSQLLLTRKSHLCSVLTRLQKEGLLVVEGDLKQDRNVLVRVPNLLKYMNEHKKKSEVTPKQTPRKSSLERELEGEGELEAELEGEVLCPSGEGPADVPLETPPLPPPQEPPPAEPPAPKKKGKTAIVNERHAAFKEALGAYWVWKNPGVDMPWDGAEGKALGMFLSASPNVTIAQFQRWLNHRSKSEVNHAERPSRWIRSATEYAAGPIDRYGKPIGAKNEKRTSNTAAGRTVDAVQQALAEIAARYSDGSDGTESGSHSGLQGPAVVRGTVIDATLG
jgi:hypothetical protein